MISNSDISDLFKLFANLLELHGENEFKAKSYHTASFRLDKLPKQIATMSPEERSQIEGIGKGIYGKLTELLVSDKLSELEELLARTPKGVLEMMEIKGIGPKKVRTIWTQLEIETVGELLYACQENRLVTLSGFGAKTQETVIKSIEFIQTSSGKLHFNDAEREARSVIEILTTAKIRAEIVGQIARNCEIIDQVELLLEGSTSPILRKTIEDCLAVIGYDSAVLVNDSLVFKSDSKIIDLFLYFSESSQFEKVKFTHTATSEFLKAVNFNPSETFTNDFDFFTQRNLPNITKEMWENDETLAWAKSIANPSDIVSYNDLKGCIHNHSLWSDGANTIAEMAESCINLGLEYFVISDHSRSATYANGLQPERIVQQHKEIDKLNQTLTNSLTSPNFKVFKSIESDILGNGLLDYEEDVLKSFDLVIASIHSNLKMEEGKANMRLLKAIENPYTRILGHPTGRLLLSRPGYPINHKLIIDACAANNVAIELNAHPYRLDIDWRWIHYAEDKGVLISINPDAHSVNGISNMFYGVCVARKAGLLSKNVINAKSLIEFEVWLKCK